MTSKLVKNILIDYCGDIIDMLHHMQIEVQNLQNNDEEKNKAMLRASYANLDKIEERITIEEMRYRKMIEEDEAE